MDSKKRRRHRRRSGNPLTSESSAVVDTITLTVDKSDVKAVAYDWIVWALVIWFLLTLTAGFALCCIYNDKTCSGKAAPASGTPLLIPNTVIDTGTPATPVYM